MGYLLALDQGTTSSRSMIFDLKGQVIAIAQKEFKQHFPKSGWVEHDAKEIWSTQFTTMIEVITKAQIDPHEILGIGITNQRETTVVWDRKTGEPIYKAIVWQDRRTTEYCDELKKKGLEETIQAKTGLLIDPYFSGTKIHWILENVQGARERAERGELCFGTIDSWLIYKLTGGKVHATDPSNASRTLLYNIKEMRYDDFLLNLLQIPASMLPEVKPSAGIFGEVNLKLFPHPIPIAGVAGDQQAALFGQGCFEKGMIKATYGTGCFILMNSGKEAIISKNHMLTTIAWQIGNEVTYALEGSVFVGGAAVQWLKEGLGLIKTSAEIELLAAKVKDTDGLMFIPTLTGIGAPYWEPKARGMIIGISRGTTVCHLALATLEGIGFQVYDVVEAMQKDTKVTLKKMRVDGKVTRSEILMQFQANLLNMQIEKPASTEMTALGAAFLAGLGVKAYASIKEIEEICKIEREFSPDLTTDLEQKKMRYKKAITLLKAMEN